MPLPNFAPPSATEAVAIKERQAWHNQQLGHLRAQVNQPEVGFFGPGSMTWRLYREPSILLGGMRALLLQIAHPAIATGVAQYSNFEKDTLGRAHRTFTSMIHIWFGDVDTACQSAKRLFRIHSMIRGTARWAATQDDDKFCNRFFTAADPDLLFWVLATLIDTTLVAYKATVGPLTPAEREQFYNESKIAAQLMGIPLDTYPKDLKDFYSTYHKLSNHLLCVGHVGAEIARALFRLPYPLRIWLRHLTGAWLPEHIALAFGLPHSASSHRVNHISTRFVYYTQFLLPCVLRFAPHWHVAHYRIARQRGQHGRLSGRLFQWLGQHLRWYFVYHKVHLH